MSDTIIETSRLTKFYGKHRGIENLDLEVHAGEIFGFLGPNGAGKTTTIRVLLGLLRKTSGEARVFGLRLEDDYRAIRDRVAYLPGELGLYASKTGAQNLRYLLSLYSREVPWRRVETLADRLDLDLDRKVKELSKGNKQKVGIVLALAPEVDLLVLDEPTSGLDPLLQAEFHEIVHEQQREVGCTVFLSSHLLPEVEKVADRVGIIREGRLVEVSRVQHLKRMALKRVAVDFLAGEAAAQFVDRVRENVGCEANADRTCAEVLCPLPDLPALLGLVQEAGFADLTVSSPKLEDVFLKYYDATTPEGGDA